jgi:hypothetical protein
MSVPSYNRNLSSTRSSPAIPPYSRAKPIFVCRVCCKTSPQCKPLQIQPTPLALFTEFNRQITNPPPCLTTPWFTHLSWYLSPLELENSAVLCPQFVISAELSWRDGTHIGQRPFCCDGTSWLNKPIAPLSGFLLSLHKIFFQTSHQLVEEFILHSWKLRKALLLTKTLSENKEHQNQTRPQQSPQLFWDSLEACRVRYFSEFSLYAPTHPGHTMCPQL